MQSGSGLSASAPGDVPGTGWPVPAGLHYLDCLDRLHRIRRPGWYLEIGTDQGASLVRARCRSIAIDPAFRLEDPALGGKPALHLFQDTSDAVFASGAIAALGARIDLAFIDGMHLVEHVLRDFINVERVMAPDGTIVLHDVVPIGAAASSRDWDRMTTRAWTGDVWKIIPILRHWRPDLRIDVLDAAPSGLAVVRSVDPRGSVLEDACDDIVAQYRDVTLDAAGRDARALAQAAVPAAPFLDEWEAAA